ncbi:hypothetical protein PF002_g29304 [Phytophthora fragariae]|uniref:SWIM-type domain-containing protein n=1 Tax=Phytophthora fragariae TaxID=53985 RepID=A0A6A3W4X5_9STRA|nr:hypothetical protein PF002_g29304 [Phytophthora fragariae]
MAKSEYGGPSSFDKDQVEDAVGMMRTSPTIDEYTKYLKYLYFLLDNLHLRSEDDIPEPKHPFLRYFMKNWDQQKERWALYARSDVPHLGNHTNNRLETSWGHIKEILKPEMPLDECVDTLIFLQALAEMEYSKKITAVGYMQNQGADEELDRLSREVSTHAYRQIEAQCWMAKDRSTHYDISEITPNMFVVSGCDGRSYHVDTSKYRCSCVFMRTTLLPCRHVMYWRLINRKSAIPIRHIAPRWRLLCKLNQPAEEEDVPKDQVARKSFQLRESMIVARRHEVLNGTTKYTTACRRGNQIADIMSRNGTTVFNAMLAALDKFEEIIKDGIAPCVSRDKSLVDTFKPTQPEHVPVSMTDQTTTALIDAISGDKDPVELDEEVLSDEVPKTLSALHDTPGDRSPATAMTQRKAQMVTGVNGVSTGTGSAEDVPTGTDGTVEVTEGTADADEVPTDTQGDAEVPTYTDRLIAGMRQSSILTKRHPASSASEGSDSSHPTSFTLTKSSKSRGRPKVRKQQKASVKKSRMARGKENAAKLVQGTCTSPKSTTSCEAT